MNSIQFYSYLALAHRPQAQEERQLAGEVKEHFRKTLSVEAVTSQLRERLVRRRKKEAMAEALTTLSIELSTLDTHDPRIFELKNKLDEMKKKIELTNPLP